jgi:phosphate transport system substrate-binding protein
VLALLLAALASGCNPSATPKINGNGSTLVAPIMSRWADDYRQGTGASVHYEAVGSTIGLKRLGTGTFDFACSDAPLTDKQRASLEKGGRLVRVPLVVGAVVPVYNLEGVKEPLVLSGPVLADVYLGVIKKWNEKPIQALNPYASLPDKPITVVHRAEGSGTTYLWTNFLSRTSPSWKDKVGTGTTVTWPTGTGHNENQGVAAEVKRVPGSIGYVSLHHAHGAKLKIAKVKNRAGAAVEASPASATAAAEALIFGSTGDQPVALVDAPGKAAYPICGIVWAVFPEKLPAPRRKAVVAFLRWATHDGQDRVAELHYARLPKRLVEYAEKELDQAGGQ